jgi:hypothetical protein
MKSQRRHELQHNVLDTELSKAVAFFKTNGTYLAWGVLIVALVIVVVTFASRRSAQKALGLERQYKTLLGNQYGPNLRLEDQLAGFNKLANQTDNRPIAADACVYLGAIYASLAGGGGGVDPALLAEKPAEMARRSYQRVIDEFPGEVNTVAKARIGLARLAEEDGDLAAARQNYQAVLDEPKLEAYPVRQVAAEGLKGLSELALAVRMVTTQPAATEPAPAASQP